MALDSAHRRRLVAMLQRLIGLVLLAVALLPAPAGVDAPPAGPQGTGSAGDAGSPETYSALLRTAVGQLPFTEEVRSGYDRALFDHWSDDDRDGCSTRFEVLLAEADDPVTVGPECSLSGGRWFSYYDRVSWTRVGDVDIDHMVPLAEAWDSGARSWTPQLRQAYANDLGDRRSLVGVTDDANRAKGDQDVAEWLPRYDRCRYLREFVAVKIRWRLSVDPAEQAAMTSLASGCTDTTITVTRAH